MANFLFQMPKILWAMVLIIYGFHLTTGSVVDTTWEAKNATLVDFPREEMELWTVPMEGTFVTSPQKEASVAWYYILLGIILQAVFEVTVVCRLVEFVEGLLDHNESAVFELIRRKHQALAELEEEERLAAKSQVKPSPSKKGKRGKNSKAKQTVA